MITDVISTDRIPKNKVEYLVQSETGDDLEDNLNHILNWIDSDLVNWEQIGEFANNNVLTEITDSYTGLVENLTNSSDAYLLQNYDNGNYRNSHEIAEEVINNEKINLVFDGERSGELSVTISDKAHGQKEDNFNVFVDPLNSGKSKQEYDFLQGCRGLGSMTSLSHTKQGYKFVASAHESNPNKWTWTVIKKGEDGNYYYLTVDNEFPSFEGDFNCGDNLGTKSYGTVIKLYSYQLPTNPNDAAEGTVFKRELSRYLPDPVVPVNIIDNRYDSSYTYSGIESEFAEYNTIKDTKTVFDDVFSVGDIKIDCLYIDPSKVEESSEYNSTDLTDLYTKSNDDRVLVSVNGQTHYRYSISELKSRANLGKIGNNMIVVVHILDSAKSVDNDIFNTGRNGYSNKCAKESLENVIFDTIQNMNEIQEIDDNLDDSDENESPKRMSFKSDSKTLKSNSVEFSLCANFDINDLSFFEQNELEFYIPSNKFAVDSYEIKNSNIQIDINVNEREESKITVISRCTGFTSAETIDIEFAKKTSNNINSSDENNRRETTNILSLATGFENLTTREVEQIYDSSNSVNKVGDPCEYFIKDLLCGTISSENRKDAYRDLLSWEGSPSNPPDIIINNGGVVEVKKQNGEGRIALNSSPPRRTLTSDDEMISDSCRNIMSGEWTKPVYYSILNVDDNDIKSMWTVDGKCIADKIDNYENTCRQLTESMDNADVSSFTSETNELGIVKNMDGAGYTKMRVRRMMHIDHPSSIFSNCVPEDINPRFNMVISEDNYESLDEEEIESNDNINKKQIEIEDPTGKSDYMKAYYLYIV